MQNVATATVALSLPDYVGIAIAVIGFGSCMILVWISFLRRHRLVLTENDKERAKKYLQEDVNRITTSMVALSDSADDWLWDSVAPKLRELAKKGADLTIIVSRPVFSKPTAKNATVRALAEENLIKLLFLDERPPVDLRLIDDRYIHASYHGIGKDHRRQCLRSKGKNAPPEDLATAQDLLDGYFTKTKPYNKDFVNRATTSYGV